MKRYPCIGGPLDGKWVTSEELRAEVIQRQGPTRWNPNPPPIGTVLRGGGAYGEYANDYHDYNRSSGPGASMIRLHTSVLPPPRAPR